MNEQQARSILEQKNGIIGTGNSLYWDGDDWYVSWYATDPVARIDGTFDSDELEALAWWVKNKGSK